MTKILPWVPKDSRNTAAIAYFRDSSSRIVLMIYRNGLLSLPAGKREKNETYINCLSREMLEELDILILSYNELFTLITNEAEQHVYVIQSYVGKLVNKEPKKHQYVGWYDEDQTIDALASHDVTDICVITLIMHAQRNNWKRLLSFMTRRYHNEISTMIANKVIKDPQILTYIGANHGKR